MTTTPQCWRCGNTDPTELVTVEVQTEDMSKPEKRTECKHTLACISTSKAAFQKQLKDEYGVPL